MEREIYIYTIGTIGSIGRSLPRGAFGLNLEAHFPFFAACSVVSPPCWCGRRQMFGPYFGYPPGYQASLHSPCFGSV